jgi:preprotein translocase subunit SecY
MKVCPNVDCPHKQTTGNPAEYGDAAESCANCGSALEQLTEREADQARGKKGAIALPVAGSDEAGPLEAAGPVPIQKLLLTVALACVPFALSLLWLPGIDQSVGRAIVGSGRGFWGMFSDLSPTALSVGAIGFNAILGAFGLIELLALVFPAWRQRRVGGPNARMTLTRWVLLVGLVMTMAQAFFFVRWLENADATFGAYGQLLAWDYGWRSRIVMIATLTTAVFLVVGSAYGISRAGLANGFSVMIVAAGLPDLLQAAKIMLRSPLFSPISLIIFVGAHVGLALGVYQLKRYVDRQALEGAPATNVAYSVLFPTGSLVPLGLAWSVVQFLVSASHFLPSLAKLANRLVPGGTPYLVVSTSTAILVTFLLTRAFYRPSAISKLQRALFGDHGVHIDASRLGRPLQLSVAFAVAVLLIEHVAAQQHLALSTWRRCSFATCAPSGEPNERGPNSSKSGSCIDSTRLARWFSFSVTTASKVTCAG